VEPWKGEPKVLWKAKAGKQLWQVDAFKKLKTNLP
jgi:hypothetical protein